MSDFDRLLRVSNQAQLGDEMLAMSEAPPDLDQVELLQVHVHQLEMRVGRLESRTWPARWRRFVRWMKGLWQ